MATEQQILQDIARNTERTAGDIAKFVGAQRRNTTERGSGRDDSGDLFADSTQGYFKSLKKLKKANEELRKSKEELSQYNRKQRLAAKEASRELQRLKENVKDQVASGANLLSIRTKNAASLDALNKMGIDLSDTFRNTSMSLSDLETEIQKYIDAKREERLANLRTVQQHAANTQKMHREARDSFSDTMENFAKAAQAAVAGFAARGSSALTETLQQGFRTGGIGGAFQGMVEGIGAGISPEEAMRFVNQNRNTLMAFDSVTNAMVSADQGLSAASGFLVDIEKTFGLRGESALQAASSALNLFANTGTRISEEGLMNLNDAVQRLAVTSELTAEQIFSEFNNLAEDSDFQAFFLSLGDQGNLVNYLSDSFLNLQESVGMNINEFMEYRKTLARERRRTGTERVVQGAFTQQLANRLGFTGEEADLLRRGTTFYESLSDEERTLFDELRATAGRRLTEQRGELLRTGQVGRLQELDILAARSPIEEQAAMAARDRAGIGGAVLGGENQQARINAANQNTEAIVELNETIRRLTEGFLKSPFGAAAGAFAAMTTATAAGVVQGMTAARAAKLFDLETGGPPDASGKRRRVSKLKKFAGRLGPVGLALGAGLAMGTAAYNMSDTVKGVSQKVMENLFSADEDARKMAAFVNKRDAIGDAELELLKAEKRLEEEKQKEQDAQSMAQVALLEKQVEILENTLEEMKAKPPEKFSIAMDE